jgi:hypothetical protein
MIKMIFGQQFQQLLSVIQFIEHRGKLETPG